MEARSERPLSEDAAIVLALASTAMPFAGSPDSEAEHWFRILRMHGEVGQALQALGAGEVPLERSEESRPVPRPEPREEDATAVDAVSSAAERTAERRDAGVVSTEDVLAAVLDVYGSAFEEVLAARGVTPDELRARLRLQAAGRGA